MQALRTQQAARGAARERCSASGSARVVESNTYSSAFYKAAGIPGSGHEMASLRVEPSGVVIASCGLMGSGQGYETTLAQAAAAGLGAAVEEVQVQIGNSDTAPYGMGSRGARGAAAGGGALLPGRAGAEGEGAGHRSRHAGPQQRATRWSCATARCCAGWRRAGPRPG